MHNTISVAHVFRFQTMRGGVFCYVNEDGSLFRYSLGHDISMAESDARYEAVNSINEDIIAYDGISEMTHVYSGGFIVLHKSPYFLRGKCGFGAKETFVRLSKDNSEYIAEYMDSAFHNITAIKASKSTFFLVNERLLVAYNKKELSLENFRTGDSIWKHALNDTFFHNDALGYHPYLVGGKILVLMKGLGLDDNECFFLACLDLDSGEVSNNRVQFAPQVDLAGDYAYGVNAHNHLYTYHIPTGEVKVHDLSGLMADHGFFVFDRVKMVGSKLYFTHRIGAHHAKAGILDYEKKEMLWKHDFDADEGSIGTLKVIDGYVYFHMQDKTLHVFKED